MKTDGHPPSSAESTFKRLSPTLKVKASRADIESPVPEGRRIDGDSLASAHADLLAYASGQSLPLALRPEEYVVSGMADPRQGRAREEGRCKHLVFELGI